jgi:phage tail protein X
MPFVTYRGEETVAELADKLYVNLNPRQREAAEAAILKANPQLRDLGSVPKGAVLHVPEIPTVRARTARTVENPDVQVAGSVETALRQYAHDLTERIKADQEEVKTQVALLKNRKFRSAIDKEPELARTAELAAKALAVRATVLKAQQKTVDSAIKQALADLDARTKAEPV